MRTGDEDALRLTALQRAREEYAELADNWKQLEGKAQATSTIAGVFLAAILAFGDSGGKALSILESTLGKVSATLVVVALCASILCAVLSLWVESYDTPTDPKQLWVEIQKALRDTPDQLAQASAKISDELINDLLHVSDELDTKNDAKATWVLWGQRFLVAGALISAMLIVARIWVS